MIITIDTAKDSREDIRRAIEFLKNIVEAGGGASSGASSDSFDVGSSSAGVFGSMFSDSKGEEESSRSGSDENSKEDGKPGSEDDVQIIPY